MAKKYPKSAPLKPGRRVYAIGDIHGCRAQMERLLDRIADDLDGYAGKSRLVFLGDYVDRGPDSAGVIERLVSGDLPGDKQHFLIGNHEAAMLEAMDGQAQGWLTYGGVQTLESYGVNNKKLFRASSIREVIEENVPEAHLDFLRSLKLKTRIGNYLFVHAGVRPGVAIKDQEARDLLWIRDEFLKSKKDHGVIVVHGHTIAAEPQHRKNRIGVDTGCYSSGTLTAVRLEGDSVDFLTS